MAIDQLLTVGKKERDKDIERKRQMRSEAARIVIPDCKDPNRRDQCLADPERFLLTYFPNDYRIKFGRHHYDMIDTICSRAKYGGRQAVAAPRGCGKTQIIKGLLVYLVFDGLVRFPLPVAATSNLAKKIFSDFQKKIATNDLLLDDFPEICYPVRALDGAPQRAGKQHVDGEPTRIVWTSEELSLPHVPGSPYGGVKMDYFGLDSAFRGLNKDGQRPDFVLVDDPETRESARSETQVATREQILDEDIAGLASQEENLSIVVLTTVQNCYCLSYRLTDPKLKPAFNGLRYGMIQSWPDNMDMWNDYIAKRHTDQTGGDEHGLSAIQFYLDNRDQMDAGVEMLSDHYVAVELDDGTQLVHSAIQQAFNKIADTSLEAYKTEYQNDPTPPVESDTLGLTAAIVSSRNSGLFKGQLPNNGECKITMGLDLGDYFGHWTKIAWFGNAVGCVVDYGVMEVPLFAKGATQKTRQVALYKALCNFSDTVMDGPDPPSYCMIDTGDGDHTETVYRFIRDVGGGPWLAMKSYATSRFKLPQPTMKQQKLVFKQCWASFDANAKLWLYHSHSEYWKQWLQERLLTPTFDPETGAYNDGSISLYSPSTPREHNSFAHHLVAEQRESRFEEGKGWIIRWVQKSQNNHWLDSTAYACCAAGCLGVELIEQPEHIRTPPPAPAPRRKPISRFTNTHGRPYLVTER